MSTHRVIYKYLLPKPGHQASIQMPRKAVGVHVGQQYDDLYVWVQVDPEETVMVERVFFVVGTGHIFEPGFEGSISVHRGTVQMPNGFVWHVYERLAARSQREEEE